jgi:hypothetical protein
VQIGTLAPEIHEASGLAASSTHMDKHAFYVVDDSPEQLEIFAINESGALISKVRLEGVSLNDSMRFGSKGTGDIEAIQVGPCTPAGSGVGSCIFVADIGQNCARKPCEWLRPHELYSIIRCPEPPSLSAAEISIECQRFFFTLPDGRYDAETLLVDPHGELFLITKVDTGKAGLYKLPALEGDGAAAAERLGDIHGDSVFITDGSFQNVTALLLGPEQVTIMQNATSLKSVLGSTEAVAGSCRQPLPLKSFHKAEAVQYEPGDEASSFSYLLLSDGGSEVMKVSCSAELGGNKLSSSFRSSWLGRLFASVFGFALSMAVPRVCIRMPKRFASQVNAIFRKCQIESLRLTIFVQQQCERHFLANLKILNLCVVQKHIALEAFSHRGTLNEAITFAFVEGLHSADPPAFCQ